MAADLPKLIPSGSRIVDKSMCIQVDGRFWDLFEWPHISVGDRVSIPSQYLGARLYLVFRDESGIRFYLAPPLLGTAAPAKQHSLAQAPQAQQQPAQTTAAAAAPGGSTQSSVASQRRLRNQGRTGPKPSRPVHSGSVMRRDSWRALRRFRYQSL